MFVRNLTFQEIKQIHSNELKRDFPPQELRPFSIISRLFEMDEYFGLGAFEGEKLIGYALIARPKAGTPLLDYYAISPEKRGAGIGSEFIKNIREAAGGSIMLEVEDPEHAENDDELKLRTRRIAFYDRAGVRMTGVRARVFGVYFAIMGFFPETIDDEDVRSDLISVYHKLFPPKMYEKEVKML